MGLLDFLRLDRPGSPPSYAWLGELGLDLNSLTTHFYFSGETGSGKTTSIKALLYAYVCWLERVGAVHSAVKMDEAQWVTELISATPMADKFVHLELGKFKMNVAGDEMSRPGGSPETLTRLLQRLNDQRRRSKGGGAEQSFWENLFFDCMHYAATLVFLAYGPRSTLEHIHQLISSMPSSDKEACTEKFKASPCHRILKKAQKKAKSESAKRSLRAAAQYVLITQTKLGSKAKTAAVQECLSILGPFMLPPFYETFASPKKSTFSANTPLEGFYTLIDVPVLLYGPSAQLAISLINTLVVEAGLRQTDPEYMTLIIRDEVASLITDPESENFWYSVARSHGLSFWSAAQSFNLLTLAFGGDEVAAKAWLANSATKFAGANSCMDTNQYFSTLYGQEIEHFHNFSERQPNSPQDGLQAVMGDDGFQFGSSTNYHERVPVDAFMHLKRGGPPHYQVEAYMSGRACTNAGLPYQLVTFHQQ